MEHLDGMGWVLAWFVLMLNLGIFAWFWRRRQNLGSRLDVCDLSLLNDPSVRLEVITDAPVGSMILPHQVAVPVLIQDTTNTVQQSNSLKPHNQ
jgi:hypothetical protein